MSRAVLAAAFTIAACGGARTSSKPAPAQTPYLALFELGRTWSLPATSEPGGAKGTVTCKVAEVKPVGDANVSRVACDPPFNGLLVVGTWVATPAGLYHPLLPVDDADELALLGEDDLLITRVPEEREHEHALGRADDSTEAFVFGDSWCVRNTIASGAEQRSYSLCFGDTGITGGGEEVSSGGQTQRTSFGRTPPAPEVIETGSE